MKYETLLKKHNVSNLSRSSIFEGVILVLIGPVPGHCLLVAFTIAKNLILYFHELGLVFLTLAGNIKRKRIIFRKAIE